MMDIISLSLIDFPFGEHDHLLQESEDFRNFIFKHSDHQHN